VWIRRVGVGCAQRLGRATVRAAPGAGNGARSAWGGGSELSHAPGGTPQLMELTVELLDKVFESLSAKDAMNMGVTCKPALAVVEQNKALITRKVAMRLRGRVEDFLGSVSPRMPQIQIFEIGGVKFEVDEGRKTTAPPDAWDLLADYIRASRSYDVSVGPFYIFDPIQIAYFDSDGRFYNSMQSGLIEAISI
jgi:hypothetical protein